MCYCDGCSLTPGVEIPECGRWPDWMRPAELLDQDESDSPSDDGDSTSEGDEENASDSSDVDLALVDIEEGDA